jgi:hypothetical protein
VCCSLLVLLLPTLVVGSSIARPAAPGEYTRLERALERPGAGGGVDSDIAAMFAVAAVAGTARPTDDEARHALLVRARLMQVLGVSAIALLTYLAVLLARGRLQALLACALVALLPPVSEFGHVLRPETPATMFSLLSLVLLQNAVASAPVQRGRRPRRRMASAFGLMACAAVATALAVATLPSLWMGLVVPGLVLVVGGVQMGFRGLRCLSRRGLEGLPIRAINWRLIPWTVTTLLAPACAVWLLSTTVHAPIESLPATAGTGALLPEGLFARVVLIALLVVGAVSGVVRVGLRFGRGGRIGSDLVLLVFCAIFLLAFANVEGATDALPALPALAVLSSEGARALLVVGLGLWARRRARPS